MIGKYLPGAWRALPWIAVAPAALALEYPIGAPQNLAGMEIAAVYLQPIDMEPEGHMRKAADSDVHIEADIQEGAWIPFLGIRYAISKVGGGEVASGDFMAMVASDGPHYGDNVKLQGPGRYRVKYTILPPNDASNALGHNFGRHTDRATGVRPWFRPFEVEWEFTYAGIGKKGGY
jgi:uncharacterized protein involved in high-affinity Fe2+ transport